MSAGTRAAGVITIRLNTKDPEGFQEVPMHLSFQNADQMLLTYMGYIMDFHCLIKNDSELDRSWSGVWEVEYTPRKKELCIIRKEGNSLVARKLVGNNNVAAGHVTWRVPGSPQIGAVVQGQSQWAYPGGVDMHWRDCVLTFESKAKIVSRNDKVFKLKFHV
jgi:hypothetical protein